ncbi:hypothetical protein [Pseudonocardia hydrocarbonoxydans]|uniref:Secreted protein n=1 Tax=Pseudonocardia hydrocarbonoxydans TaxID=76726 RepID=A0A4Y3WV86_9PSEU|nr:hypothetical protein [Pseudonocardia hydrocarbonoxydans]GEC21649.1 hypothetical protein PHY01_39320 [Pseudonocardia hydrocarbonoxydans]
MEPTVIVLIVVVVVLVIALGVAGALLSRRRRSERLQERYGSEYDRTLAETGDPRETEARLVEREKRHRSLDVRDLRPEERDRFDASWVEIQRGFVDDPVHAVRQADVLVVEIMRTRGYPVDDFEQRAEDISVEHPDVVAHYREARAVRDATEHGRADTEQQRHAVTSYRSLVEALLGHDTRHGDPHAGDPHSNGRHRTHRSTTEEPTR